MDSERRSDSLPTFAEGFLPARPSELSIEDSLRILDLDGASVDAAELRKAYYSRMRKLHPDVNPNRDTTDDAAQINAAYATLLREVESPRSVGVVAAGDIFDRCGAPVDKFFVNPFACGVDPFAWRELQDAVLLELRASSSAGEAADDDTPFSCLAVTDVDMEDALSATGIQNTGGVVTWLTAAQRAAVDEVMTEMEQTLAFEVVAWQLGDSLLRAERTNRRMQ